MAEGFDVYPPRTALPDLTLHETTIREEVKPAEVAEKWFSSFKSSLSNRDAASLSALFFSDSWWRDLVVFEWDFHSKKGPEAISKYLTSSPVEFEQASIIESLPLAPQLVDMGPMVILQFCYTFTTKFGSGRGVIRLGNDGPDSWKAWLGSSHLEELAKDKNAKVNGTNGVNAQVGIANHYPIIVVGAGQSGLMIAAQLQHLGLNYLLLNKSARPGDAWRHRYKTVRSHTPNYTDHFPFLKYPTNWPKWPIGEDLARWCDAYSDIMGLNIINNANVTTIDQDAQTLQHSLHVTLPNDEQRVLTANQVVLATGLFPGAPKLPEFAGQETFKGEIYHTMDHKSASQIADVQNKKVVIVGAGTCAHDVAKDFVQHGAKSVSMIQRGRTMVMSTDTLEKFALAQWKTPGLSTDDADLLGISMSAVLALTLGAASIPLMDANDKEMLDGLEKAGLSVGRGKDGVTCFDYQYLKGGQIYIEQGASQMIIDGRIKVHRSPKGIKEFHQGGIVLQNGTNVDADVIVLATGYKTAESALAQMMQPKVAEEANDWLWFDEEIERRGCWRPLSVPGLWFMTGSIFWGRQYSAPLAVQIAAYERGLNKPASK